MLKELILICYLLCIILCVSGLTIAMLVNRKNKKGISKNLAFFPDGDPGDLLLRHGDLLQ